MTKGEQKPRKNPDLKSTAAERRLSNRELSGVVGGTLSSQEQMSKRSQESDIKHVQS
jgi:hypothetical protein